MIVDDSGSMEAFDDGNILTGRGANSKFIACTRWAELTEAMNFHVGLAEAAGLE